MSQKMTLQEYIESRNYKRRLMSKSKSKNRIPSLQSSPNLLNSIDPSILTGSSDSKDHQKLFASIQMSDLVSQVKEIDEEAQGFSMIHKKVEDLKEFVRQHIQNDKIFVSFCKRLDELESVYRLQLIEAYRFQLFKYQFEHENNLDDEKRKMLKLLNDHYMNSKFEYKKSINKQKAELTKSQREVLQKLIYEKAKQGAKTKQENQKQSKQIPLVNSGLAQSQSQQPMIRKQAGSLLESLTMMMGSKEKQSSDIKTSNMIESKFISKAEYKSPEYEKEQNLNQKALNNKKVTSSESSSQQSNLFRQKTANIQPKDRKRDHLPLALKLKDSVQIKVNSPNLIKSPSSKKVSFVPRQSKDEDPDLYPIPQFQKKPESLKQQNPEEIIKEIDQSDVNLQSNAPSSTSGSQIVGNFLTMLSKKPSKQDQIKDSQKPVRHQKHQKLQKYPGNSPKMRQIEELRKSMSPRSKTPRKKTAKQILEQREQKQHQRLLQSKDYLRVKR